MRDQRPLRLLCLCQAALVAGHALSFPFFALYLTRVRGLRPGEVGVFMALSMLAAAAGFAWGGSISDGYGRVRVMLWSLSLRAVLSAALAAALALALPVTALLALHALSGLVGNTFPSAVRSWVADNRPSRERVEAYGWLRMAGNLGWALGPALGGALAAVSYQAMFLATSFVFAFCAVAVRLSLGASEEPKPGATFSPAGLLAPARDRRYLFFTVCAFLIAVVMAQLIAPLSMHAARYGGLDERRVGLLYSLNGLIVVLAQWPAARLIGRGRLSIALASGCVLYALGYASAGFAGGFAAFAASILLVSVAEVTTSPALQALSANLAPARERGRYLGFSGLMECLGWAVGPLLGGALQQALSPRWPAAPWLCVAALGLVAGAGFLAVRRRLTPEEEGAPAALAAEPAPQEA